MEQKRRPHTTPTPLRGQAQMAQSAARAAQRQARRSLGRRLLLRISLPIRKILQIQAMMLQYSQGTQQPLAPAAYCRLQHIQEQL